MRLMRQLHCDAGSGPGNLRRSGTMMVMSAALLVGVFAFLAFSIDVGYISLVKAQLQTATDAAALAAAQELKENPQGGTAAAIQAAQETAAANSINGSPLALDPADFTFGRWDAESRTLVDVSGTGLKPTTVQISGQLSAARGSSITLFFAPIIGSGSAELQTSAIATAEADEARDIVLVIDCSGSMEENNRIELTRAAAAAFVDVLSSNDLLSLAVYSYVDPVSGETTGHLESGLDFDHNPVINRIPELTPELYTSKTNIGGGMRVAIEEFLANPRYDEFGEQVERTMVLMTDGHANITEAPGADPVDSIDYYAGEAANAGIIIHGVTLGADADDAPISSAASTTGGEFHHVEDGDYEALVEIYQNLGAGIGNPRLVR